MLTCLGFTVNFFYLTYGIGSMYGIFTNICPKNHPNVIYHTWILWVYLYIDISMIYSHEFLPTQLVGEKVGPAAYANALSSALQHTSSGFKRRPKASSKTASRWEQAEPTGGGVTKLTKTWVTKKVFWLHSVYICLYLIKYGYIWLYIYMYIQIYIYKYTCVLFIHICV